MMDRERRSPMTDGPCELTDEEIEANIGGEIPDPWDDPEQTDWPTAEKVGE
jgi:hypothetical protein